MNRNDSAGVLIPTFTVTNGIKIPNFHPTTPDRTILGDFQPLKYNVQYKPFGVTDKTSNLFYCHDFNLDVTYHLLIGGKQYIIDSILTYKKHAEVYLEKVI